MRRGDAPGSFRHTHASTRLGQIALRRGKIEEAEHIFAETLETATHDGYRSCLKGALAACDVLRGVPCGDRRMLPSAGAVSAVHAAIVLLAEEKLEALSAIVLPSRGWRLRFRGDPLSHERRGVALLQAFAVHGQGEEVSEALRGRARAAYVGEYDYLVIGLEVLESFIEQQGLYRGCLPEARAQA